MAESIVDPDKYCRDKAAPAGSGLYYLLLFQPPESAAALAALHALELELREVLEACSQLEVARHKLGFWAQELQRMLAGEPRHPLGQALAPAAGGTEILDGELCQRLIRGYGARLEGGVVDSRRQLQQRCLESTGIIGLASARILAGDDSGAARTLQHLAAAVELLRLLRFPSTAGQPRHYLIPAEELARFQIPATEFKAGADNPRLRALKRHLLECVQQSLGEATDMIGPGPAAGFARARARMALAECRRARPWLGRGIHPGDGPSISPLRKFWIAWRSGYDSAK